MSRCFPYPPPGYTLSRACKGNLIESIKLQEEKKKAKEQRKGDKRREKKERSKEKKKDRKHNRNEKRNKISNQPDIPEGKSDKNTCAKSEQLEKSSLTQEHGQPFSLREPSTSSDSTENSNKRKRETSVMNGNHVHGTIIKIRLPSKKLDVSDASMNEQVCSTSGRIDTPTQNKVEIDLRNKENHCRPSAQTRNFGLDFSLRTDKELICSTSQKNDTVAPAKHVNSSVLHTIKASKQSSKYLQYKNLIENWVPAQLQDTLLDPEDLDWLFCNKNQGQQPEKRQKPEDCIIPCSSSSSLWQPRAQYLHEADVFALPYTIPF